MSDKIVKLAEFHGSYELEDDLALGTLIHLARLVRAGKVKSLFVNAVVVEEGMAEFIEYAVHDKKCSWQDLYLLLGSIDTNKKKLQDKISELE